MRIDRGVKLLLAVIAVALIAVAVGPRGGPVSLLQPQPVDAQGGIPKAWGKVVGFTSSIGGPAEILFEASDGTLRRRVVQQNEIPRQ